VLAGHVDVVLEVVIFVLVLEIGDDVAVFSQLFVLGEVHAQVVGGRRGGALVIGVLVGLQGLGRDLVDLGGVVGLLLVAVGLGVDGFRLFLLGFIVRRDRAHAHPAGLQRLLGVEFRRALGADGRTPAEVIELALAAGADLLCAQFRIGQGGSFLKSMAEAAAPLPRARAAVKT